MVLLHGGFALRTGHEGFALLMGAIQVLSKMGCAKSTVPTASARLTIARLLLKHEDCVAGMPVATQKCATLRAARRLLLHAAVAGSMVRTGRREPHHLMTDGVGTEQGNRVLIVRQNMGQQRRFVIADTISRQQQQQQQEQEQERRSRRRKRSKGMLKMLDIFN